MKRCGCAGLATFAERPCTVGRRLAAMGGVIGTLFVRTLDRSQRVQIAMAARGYRGEPHSLSQLRFTFTGRRVSHHGR